MEFFLSYLDALEFLQILALSLFSNENKMTQDSPSPKHCQYSESDTL